MPAPRECVPLTAARARLPRVASGPLFPGAIVATSAIQYHRRVMAVVHQKDSEVRPGAAVPARPSGARPRCRARARAHPPPTSRRGPPLTRVPVSPSRPLDRLPT